MGQIQEILGNPITDSISHHFFLFCPSWEKPDGFVIGKSMEFQLGRPPSVKRALVTEHLPFHETHRRSTQDQVQFRILPLLINDLLQDGGNFRSRFGQIGIFINDKYQTLVPSHFGQISKQIFKTGKRIQQPGLKIRDLLPYSCRQVGQLLFFALFCSHEINRRLILDKFPDQPGLPHPPPSVNYREFKTSRTIAFFQSCQFLFSADEHSDSLL